MRWYRSDVGLSRHRKTARLADALDCSIVEAVGLLHLFWEHVAEQYETGDVTEMGDAELGRALLNFRDPAAMRSALLTCNFLDALPSRGKDATRTRIVVHGWNERNAKVLRDRKRMRTVRKQSRPGSHYPPYPPTLPTNPTQPTNQPLSPPFPDGAEKSLVPEPIRGMELFENDEELLRRWPELSAKWTKLFPGVNLERQIMAAHEHQMAAPPSKRRKSMPRFLTAWFGRSEEYKKQDADRSRAESDQLTEEEIMSRLPPAERKMYEDQARREERKKLVAQKAKGDSDGNRA